MLTCSDLRSEDYIADFPNLCLIGKLGSDTLDMFGSCGSVLFVLQNSVCLQTTWTKAGLYPHMYAKCEGFSLRTVIDT